MRSSSFSPRFSATVLLLIFNTAAFLLQLAFARFSSFPLHYYFALSVEGLRHGFVWQLLTFQFMHGGWLHLPLISGKRSWLDCNTVRGRPQQRQLSFSVRLHITKSLSYKASNDHHAVLSASVLTMGCPACRTAAWPGMQRGEPACLVQP